jgi:hypothetical protein
MKSLQTLEVIAPYFLTILFFVTVKLPLPIYYYLVAAFLIGLYFFPIRIFYIRSGEKGNLRWIFSLMFPIILFLTSTKLIYSEMEWVKLSLGMFGIICFVLLIYLHIVGKLSVRQFLLIFGFGNLSSLYLIA